MLEARTTYVSSTEGVEVAVHDFGGEGPTLLLCHATGFCAHTLVPMIERLRLRYRCVAADVRGHGRTARPEGASLRWSGLAADVAAVARDLAPDGGLLAFGHSMGGTSVILSEADEPGLFGRAWLFEPILLPDWPELDGDDLPEIAQAAARRRATFASAEEARARYSGRPPLSLLDPRALDAYIEHGFRPLDDGSITLRCRPEDEALVFANHGSGSARRIHEIDLPMVLARGAITGPVDRSPAAWVQDAADANSGLAVAAYPELSHFGPLQDPDRVAADVDLFLRGES